jgi:pimeloyl-ACP methyl ester carboxylesterase
MTARRRAVLTAAVLSVALLSTALRSSDPAGTPTTGRTVRRPEGRIENRTASVFGLRMHYLEAGHGEPLVLLHGLGGTADSLRPLVLDLARGFWVFAPDQIGFGGSDKPLIDYQLKTLEDFLDGFLTEVGVDRVTLVGHSMGARVASLYALRHPERVARLVLISGAGYRPDIDAEQERMLAFSTLDGARRMLQALYFDDAAHVTDRAVATLFADRLRSGSTFAIEKLAASYRRGEGFADDLSPIKAPTLLAWGRDDEIAPVSQGEKAHRQIKGSSLVLFDHCGHLPMVEAGPELERALAAFLGLDPHAR